MHNRPYSDGFATPRRRTAQSAVAVGPTDDSSSHPDAVWELLGVPERDQRAVTTSPVWGEPSAKVDSIPTRESHSTSE